MLRLLSVSFLSVFLLFAGIPSYAEDIADPDLQVVAELDQRPANLAVTMQGYLIVSMHPFDRPETKLMFFTKDEKTGKYGAPEAFPSKEWNEAPNVLKGTGLINVIGVRAGPAGNVVVLDMGDKDHAPRLVTFDLNVQQATRESYIPRDFTTDQSFLQDFAYDWESDRVYVADMGQADLSKPAHPAIVDVLLTNGWVRRVMSDMPEFMPPEEPVKIGDKVLTFDKDGKQVSVRAALNSITIDPQNDWLYFAPMGPGKLYRVPLSHVADSSLTMQDILKRVEIVTNQKPASDGITVDSAGNIYVAAVGRDEIGVITPDGAYKPYIKDPRLHWVDGFSFGGDGYLYATVSQLDRSAFFNKGKDKSEKPFLIVKFKPLAGGAIGR